jgi:hypothetical protein
MLVRGLMIDRLVGTVRHNLYQRVTVGKWFEEENGGSTRKNVDDSDDDLLTQLDTSQTFMYPPRLWLPQLQETGQVQRGLYPILFPQLSVHHFQNSWSSYVSLVNPTRRTQQHNKHQIDINFKRDMLNQCAHENGSKSACRTMAKLYYKGAKHFGRKRRAVEVAEMGNIANGDDRAVDIVGALATEPTFLVDVLAADPGLLREMSEEEMEGLEVMVDREMSEQELKEWQALEREVLVYGTEGEDVWVTGAQMEE